MSSDELYRNYVEALSALSAVEARHREALRKAVEAAAAAESRAKTEMADQQRMYDRAGRDALEAERLLTELRLMLGHARGEQPAPTPSAGAPPQLVQIRSQISDVAQWATESTSTAESLLRTRARLAKVERPSAPAPARPIDREPAPVRKSAISTGAVIALLVAIATLTAIVLVLAQ